MNENDLSVFALGFMLQRQAKYPEHQAAAIEMCKAFVAFMDEHGLFATRPYEGPEPPRDLDIRESHLSAEGKILFRNQSIDRWMARRDDIRKPISMRVLERELKKLRG